MTGQQTTGVRQVLDGSSPVGGLEIDVMSDMNTRRGRVQGTESERGNTVVIAHVPLAEMLRYTTNIRSITGGRGYFTMEFDRYETVPQHLAADIIEAHKREQEEKEE